MCIIDVHIPLGSVNSLIKKVSNNFCCSYFLLGDALICGNFNEVAAHCIYFNSLSPLVIAACSVGYDLSATGTN